MPQVRSAQRLTSLKKRLVETVLGLVLIEQGELALIELGEKLLPGDLLQTVLRLAEVEAQIPGSFSSPVRFTVAAAAGVPRPICGCVA